MKKILCAALAGMLLLSGALANEWGLSGGIYDIVSDDGRYGDYLAIADDGNHQWEGGPVNHAVMQSRYHAVLIAARRINKVWQADAVATAAVYQPGSEGAKTCGAPSLDFNDNGELVLRYGSGEIYAFSYDPHTGQYRLAEIRYNPDQPYAGRSYFAVRDGLEFWQSGPGDAFLPVGDALLLTDGITLEEFNIEQMPRSLAEVRAFNQVHDCLADVPNLMDTPRVLREGNGSLRLPVYSAPDEKSYRSAEGKASVSLGGDIEVIGSQDGWSLIRYEVSFRTSRFGYVNRDLGGAPLELGEFSLVTVQDTFLTDDPFVSQYPQMKLPAGTFLTGLAACGEFYAYAETANGDRGFVPVKALNPVYDSFLSPDGSSLNAAVRWDVMDALIGKWEGMPDGTRLILCADGSWRSVTQGAGVAGNSLNQGWYRVYDPDDGSFTLVLRDRQDTQRVLNMLLNPDGTLTLTEGEDSFELYRAESSTFGNG